MEMLDALICGHALPMLVHQFLDMSLPITPETGLNCRLPMRTAESTDEQVEISFSGRHAALKQRMQSAFEEYSKLRPACGRFQFLRVYFTNSVHWLLPVGLIFAEKHDEP